MHGKDTARQPDAHAVVRDQDQLRQSAELQRRRRWPPGLVPGTGVYTVTSAPSKVTGATRNTVIYSAPLEFTKANYLKYNL